MRNSTGANLSTVLVCAALALLVALPGSAQRVWGRRGFSWQPEIQLAQEELAQLRADLDRLSDPEWRERALAWIDVDALAENRIEVLDSSRVGDLAFRKPAQVRALDGPDQPSQWEIRFDNKPQRTIAVVMTDVDQTRVACPLGTLLESGGALGVFQHEATLLCLERPRAAP